MDHVSIWPIVGVINEPHLYLGETSALNEEYNQAAYIVHRQHTGEEVHDAHGPTALNSGV